MKRCSRHRLAIWLKVLLTLALFGLLGTTLHANHHKELAIIISKELPIYQRTLEAVRSELPPDISVHVFTLKQQAVYNRRVSNRLKSYPFDCLLTIGAKATQMAIDVHGERPVISCMTLLSSELSNRISDKVHIVPYLPSAEHFIKVLKRKCPEKKRVGLIWADDVMSKVVKEQEKAFTEAGYTFKSTRIDSHRKLPRELKKLSREIDLFLLLPEPLLLQKEALRHLLLHLLQNEIPVLTFSPGLVRAGALFGLSYPIETVAKQVGDMVKECASGKNPTVKKAEPTLSTNERVAKFLKIGQ